MQVCDLQLVAVDQSALPLRVAGLEMELERLGLEVSAQSVRALGRGDGCRRGSGGCGRGSGGFGRHLDDGVYVVKVL